MKIAFVSTFLDQCGIATYTEELSQELQQLGHQVVVLAEQTDAAAVQPARWEIPYERCWSRSEPASLPNVLAKLHAIKPNVIHVQHEFGLFPDDAATVEFLEGASEIAPTFVTLHTVFQDPWRRSWFFSRMVRFPCVVHSYIAQARVGYATCIPHGTLRIAEGDVLGDYRRTYLTTGLFSGPKGIPMLVKSFCRAVTRKTRKQAPNAKYILAGRFEKEVRLAVNEILRDFGNGGVEIRDHFQSFEELDKLYRSADCVLLNALKVKPGATNGPIGSNSFSTSGQAHLALAYKLPAIFADSPMYDDIEKYGVGVRFRTEEELDLLIGESFSRLPTGSFDTVPLWDVVAKQHLDLYERVR